MRYFLPFIILLACMYGCGADVDARLSDVEKLMPERADSALTILHGLEDGYEQMGDEDKALFGLLLTWAADYVSAAPPADDYINFSVEYYSRAGSRQRLAESYLYRARLHKERREYDPALRDLLKAGESADPREYHFLGKLNFDIGHLASFQDELEKALEYYETAAGYFEKAGSVDNLSKVYLMQGLIYQYTADPEAVIGSYRRAMEIAVDSIVIGDALNDMGNYYLEHEELDSALVYTRRSLAYPYYDTNMSMRYYNMANIFYLMDRNDSAVVYVRRAMEYPIDIYYESECYRLLANVAFEADDKDGIDTYLKAYHQTLDTIKLIEQQTNINILEEIHRSDVEKGAIRGHRNLLYVAVAIVLLVGAAVSLLLYRRSKGREEQAGEYRAELEKKQEMMLLELRDELERTRTKYAAVRKKADFQTRQQIDKSVYNDVLHLDDERSFTARMNKVLNRLPEKLRGDYPDLTYKEIVWCCLFVLGVPTPDISTILDYTQSSQYKFKQRLAKKLGLDGTRQLEQMLFDKVNI